MRNPAARADLLGLALATTLPRAVPNSHAISLALWLPLASVLFACGASKKQLKTYSEGAKQSYMDALSDFRDGNCLDAAPAFRRLRRNYPYSRFAALAELRAADCLFQGGKYIEAIQAYRRFVRYRPSHFEVPYARFRIVEGYYEQIPSDWLLAPPAYERDQGSTTDALGEIRRFLQDFPDDPKAKRAKRMAQDALALLARHELYVARFYRGLGQPRASVGRLRTMLRSYPQSGLEREALLMLGETYLELREPEPAREAFTELVRRYPSSSEASRAKSRLLRLPAPGPKDAAAKPRPAPKADPGTARPTPRSGASPH